MLVHTGGDQSGVVGKELAQALRVRVTNSHGKPVAAQLVTFHVTSGGGSTFSGANLTNRDGIAQERWTLGTNTGEPQRLEARAVDNRSGDALVFATFSATPLPDVPASLQIDSGDHQTTVVGSVLADPCVVAVSDQYGNDVPAVPVEWTVETGGGLASPATSTTDGDGRAAVSWTLGEAEGEQQLRAAADGLDVSFHATALARPATGTPASIAKLGGDGQIAAPGTAVATAPTVVVLDSLGAPVVGAEVTFAVSLGGGSIESTTAQTDAGGRASCGKWTLGPSKGLNSVRASVSTLAPVTFSASAANVSPEVAVTVIKPSAGQTIPEDLSVAATVASTYQLATVMASVRGASVQLAYGPYGRWYSEYAWGGELSLVGQPRGPIDLVVTATDVFGHTTDAVVGLILDRPPVVTVSAPLDGSIARPQLDLAAACTDDDPAGCRSLEARVQQFGYSEGVVIASGTDTLSQQVDLSAYEGQSVSVIVTGEDSIGQRAMVSRRVFVESSSRLRMRTEVSGAVWDVAGSRTLFLDLSGSTPALKMLDDAVGTTQTVETGPDLVGTWGDYGYVTPTGALYAHGSVTEQGSPYCWLFEWRQGVTTRLTGLNSCDSLRVSGRWAVYSEAYDLGYHLARRDLETGSSELVTTNAGNCENDVASNGDVAFWTGDSVAVGYNIHRWRSGTDVALTSDPSSTLWNTYPVTDGNNVVYRKHTPCCGEQTYRIAMHDGATETVLTAATATEPSPGRAYAAAGGYVAYAAEDTGKVAQIWRHGPNGEEQLTSFGTSSMIDAIGPDGTVVFVRTSTGRRYRAVPGAALQEIGSALGRVVFRDGVFLVILGRNVLEVVP